jgi:integral membrane sensor domain MASE1
MNYGLSTISRVLIQVGVRPPLLVAVGQVLLLWVESGRLRHVTELFVTAHCTGKSR